MFKFHEGQLAHSEVQLEVLIDDYMFPAYTSPKIHSQTVKSSDIGEAFVRELEFSKLNLRLVSKDNPKDSSEENTVAKLTGDTLSTLQRILVSRHTTVCVYRFLLTCYSVVYSDRAYSSLEWRRHQQGHRQRSVHSCADEARPNGKHQQHGYPAREGYGCCRLALGRP